MNFILIDQKTNKVLTGIMGDGMYYSMENGDIPINSIIFNDDEYNDMLKYEPIIDDINGSEIDINQLTKVKITRK
jgi:hypothetical protein